jgi:hypothetical protein
VKALIDGAMEWLAVVAAVVVVVFILHRRR